ncbi:MAG: SsrA-binding protein SmpB [bacterium]
MIETKTVCRNKKALFEYEILETVEAGLILQGTEVKSIRQGLVSLDGSYAILEKNKLMLVNCTVQAYKNATTNHNPQRDRILLLKKSEIKKFAEKSKHKGFTLVPISMFIKKGMVKVDLAICKGRQLHDKREFIKSKEISREMKEQ